MTRPEANWRWARRAAVTRLIEIGGPDADAARRDRYLSPLDPPWRDDPTWLRTRGVATIPLLIEKLGELRAVEAMGALCEATRSTRFLPIAAIEALGKIGSTEAVPTLIECIQHAHSDVRDHALRALDRIGDPHVADAAIAACDDPHPVVRDRAALVLARHGDERAVPQLIRLCDGRHAAIAADALTRIGDPRALPTLWHLFRTAPDKRVRHAAGRGLAHIEGRREYVHGADLPVRRAYIWLLGHKPQWKPDYEMKRAIADDDPIVRARAAAALARLGDPSAVEQVRRLLEDPDPRVRANAATALGCLGAAHAREWLIEYRSDSHPDVRSAVTAALSRIDAAAS